MKRSAKVVLTLLAPAMAAFGCGQRPAPPSPAGEFNSEFSAVPDAAPGPRVSPVAPMPPAGTPLMTKAVGDIPALPVLPPEGGAIAPVAPPAVSGLVAGAAGAQAAPPVNLDPRQIQIRNLIQYVDREIHSAWQQSSSTAVAQLRRAKISVQAWGVDQATRDQQLWRLTNAEQEIVARDRPRRSSGGLFAWLWGGGNSSSSYRRSSYGSRYGSSYGSGYGSSYGSGSRGYSYGGGSSQASSASHPSTPATSHPSNQSSWGGSHSSGSSHSSSTGHVSRGGFGRSSGFASGGS